MPLRRRRGAIGYGTWGSNLFQSLYDRTPSTLGTLPMMPEWYLLLALLAVLSIVGIFHNPLVPWTSEFPVRIELLLLAAATLALAAKAVRSAWHAPKVPSAGGARVRTLTAVLFLLQPVARLTGRMRGGLTPWRRRGELVFAGPYIARLGTATDSLSTPPPLANWNVALIMENLMRNGRLWYAGLVLMGSTASYQNWLLFPDTSYYDYYPRIVGGYEF